MTIECAQLLSPDGAIARRIDGFEARPQQVAMAAAVEAAFDRKGRLLVEAGTGGGVGAVVCSGAPGAGVGRFDA